MKALVQGEKILHAFDASSLHGKGKLFVSNIKLNFEDNSKGIVFEQTLDKILKLEVSTTKKKQLKIFWIEKSIDDDFSLEIICNDAQQAHDEIANAINVFGKHSMVIFNQDNTQKEIESKTSEPIPVVKVTKEKEPTEIIDTKEIMHSINSDSVESSEEESSPESTEEHVEEPQSVKEEPIVSFTIPDHIKEDQIWNDCWYDEKEKIYVTHNLLFTCLAFLKERDHQKKYEKQTKDSGIIANADKVKMFSGLPAVKLPKPDGKYIWTILPTVTPEMESRELKMLKNIPDEEQQINYITTQ